MCDNSEKKIHKKSCNQSMDQSSLIYQTTQVHKKMTQKQIKKYMYYTNTTVCWQNVTSGYVQLCQSWAASDQTKPLQLTGEW